MNPAAQDYFRIVLLTVVGQAFGAAGYTLEERPTGWAGGQYRFIKPLDDGLNGFIEFQNLSYAEGQPSRFRVTLTRTDQPSPAQPSAHPRFAQRLLSALVVTDFQVPILPSPTHWWLYADTTQLGRALGEAGSLTIGYALPWLSGDLTPPV